MATDKAPLVFRFQLLVYKISGVSMAQISGFLVEQTPRASPQNPTKDTNPPWITQWGV